MSRINRKHNRNLQRHRRNKGPEMLSQAADKQLQEKAPDIVRVLFEATMKEDSAAANLLVGLAESAEYPEAAALAGRAVSWAQKLRDEPPYIEMETTPGLPGKPPLQLTSGTPENEEILDAEVS